MSKKRRRIVIEVPKGYEYLVDELSSKALLKDSLISFLESRSKGYPRQWCEDKAEMLNDNYYVREEYISATVKRFKLARVLQRGEFKVEDYDSPWDYDEDEDS